MKVIIGRDLMLAGTQQSVELKLALDQEQQKSKKLEESMRKLDEEMRRTDELLYQMIPKQVADRLRTGENPIDTCEVCMRRDVTRGVFVTEVARMPFWKLFLGRMQARTAFWKLFSRQQFYEVRHVLLFYRSSFKQTSIFCTVPDKKTNPTMTKFWVSLCLPKHISLEE
jgi:hypothetical protein